jgi:hypothetical protein
MFVPRHSSGEEPLRSFARAGDQPKEQGISSRASPRPGRRHRSLHAWRELKIGRSLDSRHRGLLRFPRRGLARTFSTGRVGGCVDGGVVPRREVFGGRRWGQVSPGRSSLRGWRGAGLKYGSRAGNSVHGHLWARRILRPSLACHELQPRRAAIVFNAARVAANLLPARLLEAGGLESRGRGFPGSGDGRRLGSQANGKGRPAKMASATKSFGAAAVK